jgi:transcriptional regulator
LPKADKLQGSLDLLVLKVLSRRPSIHGYAISAAVREFSGEVLQIEDGSLYPALHRMEETGWIKAKWITKENGGRSRVYELAAAGKKQLASEEARWRNVTFAVDRVLRTV